MVDLLSSPDKTKQRTDGHKSKFFVSVAIPATLLSAQVNSGALARGAIAIPFDNGTSVGVSLLRAGQTVKVVNVYGTFVTRLASVSTAGSSPNITGTLTVDPNNIVWPDDGVLVVEDMHDPRTIPPEFDATTGISQKRSQVFTGQTAPAKPIVQMGGHKVKMLSGGSAIFNLNGSGIPVAPGATISSYLWQCAEGTIAAPTDQNTTITV